MARPRSTRYGGEHGEQGRAEAIIAESPQVGDPPGVPQSSRGLPGFGLPRILRSGSGVANGARCTVTARTSLARRRRARRGRGDAHP